MRQHRLADDIADGVDVRHVGAHLIVGRDESAVGHHDAGLVGADLFPFGLRPTESRTMSYGCAFGGACSPSKLTYTASFLASMATVLVLSMTRSKRCLFILSHTRTRSRSAPSIKPSSISTTSSREPNVEYTVPISRPMMPPP